jgi:hypothetical protein
MSPYLLLRRLLVHASLSSMCSVLLAKQRRTWHRTQAVRHVKEGQLTRENLKLGDRVSVDQYESSVLGRSPTTRVRESPGMKFCGGTILLTMLLEQSFASIKSVSVPLIRSSLASGRKSIRCRQIRTQDPLFPRRQRHLQLRRVRSRLAAPKSVDPVQWRRRPPPNGLLNGISRSLSRWQGPRCSMQLFIGRLSLRWSFGPSNGLRLLDLEQHAAA